MASFSSIIGGTGALGRGTGRAARGGRPTRCGSVRATPRKRSLRAGLTVKGSGRISRAGLCRATGRGEIVILTVHYAAHAGHAGQIREAAQGRIVVDTTVPLMPPKGRAPCSSRRRLRRRGGRRGLGPGVRVVSALQNIGAEKLASGGDVDSDVLVCGDDARSVEVVRALLASWA
jgi:predicted dinucleotide-binding enzyme